MIKVRIKENSLIARLAAYKLGVDNVAIVFGATIHLYNTSATDFIKNKSWLCHELKHVEQYRQYGMVSFLWLYLVSSLKHGYKQNRFEVEAREAEADMSILDRFKIDAG